VNETAAQVHVKIRLPAFLMFNAEVIKCFEIGDSFKDCLQITSPKLKYGDNSS
jgi:hypothetical protein